MDEYEIRRLIESCEIFEPLSKEERNELVRHTHVRGLHTREILIHQGDRADSAFIVAKGQIKLFKTTPEGDQVTLAVVTPGLLFAVVSLMRKTTYPISAEATVPSEVLFWRREDMIPVVDRHPEIAIHAIKVISDRMHELQDRYRELATMPVPQRLARTLIRLEAQRELSHISAMRLSRQDLAEMIGSTVFTVSRILAAWHERGLVDTGRETVAVLEPAKLQRLSEGEGEEIDNEE